MKKFIVKLNPGLSDEEMSIILEKFNQLGIPRVKYIPPFPVAFIYGTEKECMKALGVSGVRSVTEERPR